MLKLSDFLLASVPKDDTDFRSFLETVSPDGERFIDYMTRRGITIEVARASYEQGEMLRAHMAAKRGQRTLTS